MAEVTITLNGRTYRLECGDGEEEHLLSLSDKVGECLGALQKQFGQVGDDRLLLMSALTIADELNEAQKTVENLEAELAGARNEVADQFSTAAGRIEVLSAALTDGPLAEKGE
ncbi:cell division protein ZapA [bacterium BMS3Bbin10]|nr:cell division protein ZapA [bacterium BMS3Bbin10]